MRRLKVARGRRRSIDYIDYQGAPMVGLTTPQVVDHVIRMVQETHP